jgi:hypothetical protein
MIATPNDNDIEAGLVVLGASLFPSSDLSDNESFKRSKNAFIHEAAVSGIRNDRILDLFDTDLSVSGLVDRIDDAHSARSGRACQYCRKGV